MRGSDSCKKKNRKKQRKNFEKNHDGWGTTNSRSTRIIFNSCTNLILLELKEQWICCKFSVCCIVFMLMVAIGLCLSIWLYLKNEPTSTRQ